MAGNCGDCQTAMAKMRERNRTTGAENVISLGTPKLFKMG
jgi:hypothetical protein